MKLITRLSTIFLILLNACSATVAPGEDSAKPGLDPALLEPVFTPTVITPIITPIFTSEPVFTEPAYLESPQVLPTPRWSRRGPDLVICPILLYHRIARSQTSDPYYVPPEEFQAQMQALKNWGYTSIPISLLVDAINYGVKMPPRPIVITFDDGDVTVYSQAFPIMREYGFIGVNYLVTNYVGTDGYMGVEQLKELAAAGWQTGSHSISHVDLTSIKILAWEVVESHHKLEKLLGVPVKTFAYPFGKMNEDARILVQQKYSAGVGLGVYVTQRRANLDYLWRRPVKPGWDVETFGAFLPWNTPPEP